VDKKSIIAIAITAVAIMAWFLFVNPIIMAKLEKNQAAKAQATVAPIAATPAPAAPAPAATASLSADAPAAGAEALSALNADIGAAGREVKVTTDVLELVFSADGGILRSAKALKHLDGKAPVALGYNGDSDPYFFGHAFGDRGTLVSREPMRVRKPNPLTLEFSRAYEAPGPGGALIPFTLRKTFSFKPDEYMFELKIAIENSVNAAPSLNKNNAAYTLFMGPQIGPRFEKLSNYGDTRRYWTFSNGKKKEYKIKPKTEKLLEDRVRWATVTGKYFSLVAVPDATAYTVAYNTMPVGDVASVSQLSLSRPPMTSSVSEDVMRFYLGPNVRAEMIRYSDGKKNAFGYSDLYIEKSTDANVFLGWLEWLLKKAMELFYAIVRNWGVSIILVTILVKALSFPLTLKSSVGTAKMAELQPKIQEIQAKYKDKPDRLNQELMEFYKREGYNPLSGCLPMLIQLPLFFAMYQLFNTHFDLRNAMFIPGWIPDLSQPDSVFSFSGFTVLGLTFNAIRILPVIYLVSQLFYGKYTQSNQAPGQNAAQMKFMMYGLPILFFFILYNAPAGLLVYWITSNLLTIVQQMITNRIIHDRKLKAQRS